ncbi:MAG: site-specific integrase [Planctomycetes bacterium]|nr:site-specific integrase [Planctomycetota bacterium]
MARSRVYRNPAMRTAQGRPAWCLDYVGIDGRRKRERTTAHTREEASALLRARLAEIDKARARGLISLEALNPVTFRAFSREFLAYAKARVRPRTYRLYSDAVNRLIPTFGDKTLASITPGDVEGFMTQRKNSVVHAGACNRGPSCTCPAVTAAAPNRDRGVLSNVLSVALRHGLVERNVVSSVKPLKEPPPADCFLEPDEERRLLDAAADWLKPIIRLALATGMRRGELLTARRCDVDFERRMLKLPVTKNGKVRHVPLNRDAMEVIESLPVAVGADEPRLFYDPDTLKPWRDSSISHAFRRAVKVAGLPAAGTDRVRFHTLRHTAVSRLVAAGVPDRIIMKLVGHSSGSMVSRYAHLAPDSLRPAVEALEKGRFPAQKGTLGANFRDEKRAHA